MIYFLKHLFHAKGIAYRYDQIFDEIKNNKPKNIMEVGVWTGERARKMITIASRFYSKEQIHYFGFDFFDRMDSETYKKEISKQPPTLSEIKLKLDKTKAHIHLFKGDTTIVLQQEQKNLPEMDLIFIDGGHSLETVASDWLYSSKIVRRGGVVIFDDYWTNRTDGGSKVTVDAIDRSQFKVEILPTVDSFEKTEFGPLVIQLAKATKL